MNEAELFELARKIDDAADDLEWAGHGAASDCLRAAAEAIREVLPEGGLPVHLVNAAAAGWPL